MPTCTPTVPATQQPCIHCGDCAHACPEALNPEALFFALAGDDYAMAQTQRLDACTDCNRCVEVCPSHIPLLEWFRWGKSELRRQVQADTARGRFLARNARLARERASRAARRDLKVDTITPPVQTISRNEVFAAIARGRAKRKGNS